MSFSLSLFSSGLLLSIRILLTAMSFTRGNAMDIKVLQVGRELMKETLPLQSGSRLYELQGLNSNKWYEVKISYPASIPATFTLQLSKGSSGLNVGRKLLNTEKIIFQADSLQLLGDKGGTFILVNVEPEGIVAIPGVKERKHIIYNIVCDELLFGIPHQAWYVVVLVVLCLVLALVIPSFLPSYLLPINQGLNAANHAMSDQPRELQRSPPNYEALRFMAAGTLGAALVGLSSLTFAGTVIFLVLVTPFLVIFSPILVPAVIIHVLITAGFVFSGGSGIGGLAATFWMYRNIRGKHLFGADQLDLARMRIAGKTREMKERAKEGGQFVQNKAQEATQD